MRKSGERRTILVVPNNRERSATEPRHIFNWSNRRIKRRSDVDDAVMNINVDYRRSVMKGSKISHVRLSSLRISFFDLDTCVS